MKCCASYVLVTWNRLIDDKNRKDKDSFAFIKEKSFPVHTHRHTHLELKRHYLAGSEDFNKTEETGERRKRTKMVFNAFIIQMNENHINESRQKASCTSV